ncbi:venom carboxylesterase-6-like isoform X1 [Prorops nasuta]|uniref:venom carboxylesterase-6-like isoform X1 n=1 Tax=Prorops nasuta TaxID=863751 RepID=UPI0034CD35CA
MKIDCAITLNLIVLVINFYFESFVYAENLDGAPIVLINTGYIKGYYKTSNNGRKYRAFEGIPYAMPPVGKLRFQPPMQMFPWQGVALTNSFGSICMQYNPFLKKANNQIEGSEDCLYINVYTPITTNEEELLPILFFIHGGEFQYSGGSLYDPKYLLDRDVILVTFNYRLGPLGFMSTEDDVVPGNMGLKDQGLALRWTSDNAKALGGNNNKITIVGQGSGAASAQYHYQSHWSAGYFQNGISASGTAFNSWALTEGSLEKTLMLGDLVGCPFRNVITIVECMQHRPANQLVGSVGEFLLLNNTPFAPFGPVVEKGGRYPFIEYDPITAFKEKKAQDLPWLTGVVSQEGLNAVGGFITNNEALTYINDKWEIVAPLILDFNRTIAIENQASVANRIRHYYIRDKKIDSSLIKEFVQMASDRLYIVDAELAAKTYSQFYNSPVWFYYYNYKGTQSYSKFLSKTNYDLGVSHLDDIALIFETPFTNASNEPSDIHMREKLIDIWVSFATNGTPNTDVYWKPLDPYSSHLNYLYINRPDKIYMDHTLHLGETSFWDSIDFNENK